MPGLVPTSCEGKARCSASFSSLESTVGLLGSGAEASSTAEEGGNADGCRSTRRGGGDGVIIRARSVDEVDGVSAGAFPSSERDNDERLLSTLAPSFGLHKSPSSVPPPAPSAARRSRS